MRPVFYTFAILCCFLTAARPTLAESLYMARVNMSFPETMLKLQDTLREYGYKVSRVQRIDIGLTKSGFKTDKYRIVFYGKPQEVKKIIEKNPELSAYLPLKIAIFAEGTDTLLVAAKPGLTMKVTPDLTSTIGHWERDLISIFKDMRRAE